MGGESGPRSGDLSPDKHHLVINGRRWRASDPTLSGEQRQTLVDELMAARRAVGAALRAKDGGAERAARSRVHAAKVALGERGPKWWEQIEAEILRLVDARGDGKTICPSEVARSLAPDGDFRRLMPHVRESAATLAERGAIAVTQKGEKVDARSARGPIRLGQPSS